MSRKRISGKRLFILDTNVLMHDPTAIFRFKEHDVYLPMVVLEELDRGKKGLSEVARNARQASRFLDDLLRDIDRDGIHHGIALKPAISGLNLEGAATGKLWFQTELGHPPPATSLLSETPDNDILNTALEQQQRHPDRPVTLVSKDINLRIKATILGIHAEDYYSDQVLEDVELLYSGSAELPTGFWESHGKEMESWQEEGHTYYRITGPLVKEWYPNICLYMTDEQAFRARVVSLENGHAIIEVLTDYTEHNSVWGIHARNREQDFALNLLMNPDLDFVSLVGTAGTGKTLLTLAAGLAQTLDENRYTEIIMTRVTVPVGEDIGFLPGTEEEKMTPWMGALMDNLEVLTKPDDGGSWGQAVTNELLQNRIKVRSLNFMRGRTFLNKYLIIDEAQNLTAKQMKTLITRAGPGTKIVCLGNIAQIDTPYLTETSSGLTYVVDRFKHWQHSGHITLTRGERSRLADFASEAL